MDGGVGGRGGVWEEEGEPQMDERTTDGHKTREEREGRQTADGHGWTRMKRGVVGASGSADCGGWGSGWALGKSGSHKATKLTKEQGAAEARRTAVVGVRGGCWGRGGTRRRKGAKDRLWMVWIFVDQV